MGLSSQEIVDAAVRLEEDGRAFYLDAAGKTANELTRRMLESLAADEANHIEWIKQNAGAPSSADVENQKLYASLRGIFAEAPDEVRRGASSADDIGAIDVAIGMEEASANQYAKWREEAGSAELEQLLGMLADVEKFHKQLLVNTKEYLDNTADWFMAEEQWNFEGG